MTNAIERSILGESEKLSDRANFTLRSRARDYDGAFEDFDRRLKEFALLIQCFFDGKKSSSGSGRECC
jgi:hypothetical protein